MSIISLIEDLEDIIDDGGTVPFSKKVTVNPDEIYSILNELRESVPKEIRDAEWVNQERDRILSEAHAQANSINEKAKLDVQKAYDEANSKFRELVSEHNVTKKANEEAERIVGEAKKTAHTIATNSMQYVDDILAKTSDDLKRVVNTIEENRSKLKA